MQISRAVSGLLRAVYISCITALSVGCASTSGKPQSSSDSTETAQLAMRFYAIQKSGSFAGLNSMYAPQTLATPESGRVAYLNAVTDRLGNVREVTLESWQSSNTVSGQAYELVYQVVRSKNMAREFLTLVREGDSLRVGAYEVQSEGIIIAETPIGRSSARPR